MDSSYFVNGQVWVGKTDGKDDRYILISRDVTRFSSCSVMLCL